MLENLDNAWDISKQLASYFVHSRWQIANSMYWEHVLAAGSFDLYVGQCAHIGKCSPVTLCCCKPGNSDSWKMNIRLNPLAPTLSVRVKDGILQNRYSSHDNFFWEEWSCYDHRLGLAKPFSKRSLKHLSTPSLSGLLLSTVVPALCYYLAMPGRNRSSLF